MKCRIRRKGRIPHYSSQRQEEAEMMAVLQRCKASMCQVFVDQTVIDTLVDEDFMEAFSNSPEYAAALEAFKKRFEAEHGRP